MSEQNESEVVSIGRWMLALFLVQITCGIALIVYCFNGNKNLANWARGTFLLGAVVFFLVLVLTVVQVSILGNQVSNTFEHVSDQMYVE